jgi:hypothetical protein
MNLKVPIEILDELAETVIRSTGSLDLASGEIFDVRYEVDRPGLMDMPAVDEEYEFTSGVLSNEGKDVEFRASAASAVDRAEPRLLHRLAFHSWRDSQEATLPAGLN